MQSNCKVRIFLGSEDILAGPDDFEGLCSLDLVLRVGLELGLG